MTSPPILRLLRNHPANPATRVRNITIGAGSFVFPGQDGDSFTLRRLAEDEAGALYETDESHDIPIDHAAHFIPSMSIGRI